LYGARKSLHERKSTGDRIYWQAQVIHDTQIGLKAAMRGGTGDEHRNKLFFVIIYLVVRKQRNGFLCGVLQQQWDVHHQKGFPGTRDGPAYRLNEKGNQNVWHKCFASCAAVLDKIMHVVGVCQGSSRGSGCCMTLLKRAIACWTLAGVMIARLCLCLVASAYRFSLDGL
jgi:hypothetical protein